MVQWSPFVMSFKKKYPWIQLAGHAGSTVLPDFPSGTRGSLGSHPAPVGGRAQPRMLLGSPRRDGSEDWRWRLQPSLPDVALTPPREHTDDRRLQSRCHRAPCLCLSLCLSQSLSLSPSLTQ